MKGDFHVRFCERLAGEIPACLLDRKRGCMPADSFVRIWKFIARPNLCGTPACVKPPPRYRQCPEKHSAIKECAEKLNVKLIISKMLKRRLNFRNVAAIAACLIGFSANNALAQNSDTKGNSAFIQVKDSTANSNFTLKKSDKIVINPWNGYSRKGKNVDAEKLEQRLKELGFCCVYQKINENATNPNFVITMHPTGPSSFGFRIRDLEIDKEVFFDSYAAVWKWTESLEKFIKAITPFIKD